MRLAFGIPFTAAVFAWAAAAHAATFELRWKADPADASRTIVEASGVPKPTLERLAKAHWAVRQWQALLDAVTEPDGLAVDLNVLPMAGTYQITGDTLRFSPAFPLTAGVSYRATFRPSALPGGTELNARPVTAQYRLEPPAVNATTLVSAVYPSAAVLPENLLKFYLHFSAPMRRGHSYDNIHLRDAAGKDVDLPFLELNEELWNPGLTRLTLLLDPGRIKRGVRPLEEVGPALEEGRSYTLVIDRAWQDATGNPLREAFTKKFTVGPADRDPPDPAAWKLTPPAAHSRDAVELRFPKPLDQALAERVFRVVDAAGKPVPGLVSLGAEEREWRFVPGQPWPASSYTVQVPVKIEDLAGNNIGKPFDVDLLDGVPRGVAGDVVTLPFSAR